MVIGEIAPVAEQAQPIAYDWLHRIILDLPVNHERTIEFDSRIKATRSQSAAANFAKKIKASENGYKLKTRVPQGSNFLVIAKFKIG